MNLKYKMIKSILLSFALVIPLYIFLHECGHLIVMLSAGAEIDDFSILQAHVSGHGGSYTYISKLWMHANGAFLPVVVSAVYTLLYHRRSESVFYRVFSCLFVITPTFSLLAWVLIPIAYMNGTAPAGDDVTQFLDAMQLNNPAGALWVSAAALLLILLLVCLLLIKGIPQNYSRTIKELKEKVKEQSQEGA